MPPQSIPPIMRVCQQCQITFPCSRCEVRRGGGRFCSQACVFASRVLPRVAGTCSECGKPTAVLAVHARRGNGKTCSYACSNARFSRLRQQSLESKFWAKVSKTDSCWLWTGRTRKGYGVISRRSPGTRIWISTHRFSWQIHHGPIPEGMEVLHRCDVPTCVNPDHLFLGTNLVNIADRNAKGRQAKGESAGLAALTEDEVRQIRREYIPRLMSYPKLARKHHVSPSTVRKIVRRETWAHLE